MEARVDEKTGEFTVKRSSGRFRWRRRKEGSFCSSATPPNTGRLDGVATMFNSRSISQLTPCLRPAGQVLLGSPHRCPIHRSICHHARRRPVRPGASSAIPQVELRRSAKTQAKVKLKDLPQGVLKLDAYDDGVDDAPRYPTVVQGHRNNMQKFRNCVVLTRVGGFYEVKILDTYQEEELADSLVRIAILRASRRVCAVAQSEACLQEDQRRASPYGWLSLLPARSVFEDSRPRPQQIRGY